MFMKLCLMLLFFFDFVFVFVGFFDVDELVVLCVWYVGMIVC